MPRRTPHYDKLDRMMEGDVPFDPARLRHWNTGRPFIVRANGKEEPFPANACWREEDDGRLRIGGTLDREHMRLNPDSAAIAETGSLNYIGDYEYAPGTWSIEHVLPE